MVGRHSLKRAISQFIQYCEEKECNNVEVVYDTSPGTSTRVVRRGSWIGGTKALDAQEG
jgi:flavorubredoxin